MFKAQLSTSSDLGSIRTENSLTTIISVLQLWHRNLRTRRQLQTLPRERYADIGLSEATKRAECEKWFWQL